MNAEAMLAEGARLHRAGDLAAAERIYRQVLRHDPEHCDALNLLAAVAMDCGQPAAAAELVRRSIELTASRAPGAAPAPAADLSRLWINLANALERSERRADAIAALRQALRLDPSLAGTWLRLSQLLFASGDCASAADTLVQATRRCTGDAGLWGELGFCLHKAQRPEDAIAAYRRSVELEPRAAGVWSNISAALREIDLPAEALAACERALELEPQSAAALTNLGSALYDLHRPGEAVEAFARAIALSPPLPAPPTQALHANKAFALLAQGKWEQGWSAYEHRRLEHPPPSGLTAPRWDGAPLNGKTLLVWAEQGFGDTIQFLRYARVAAERRGARVAVAVQDELIDIARTVPGVAALATRDEINSAVASAPLLSLPRILAADSPGVPVGDVPYVFADAPRVEMWARRIASGSERGKCPLRVGVSWSSNTRNATAKRKSCPIRLFSPLARVADVAFYSLQKGEIAAEAEASGLKLIDFSAELRDFADTAALLHHLDLIITIDTAVAHLAGAMGKLVWTLLPHASDWRWFFDRDDSPWYPAMRLFRQPTHGDWKSAVDEVSVALAELAALARGRDERDSRL